MLAADAAPGDDGPIPVRTLALFSLPSLTLNIFVIALYSFLPPFYAGDLGIGLTLTGAIFMCLRMLDLVVDPLLGNLLDRHPTRFGRRRPWIALSVLPFAVGTAFVFFPSPPVTPLYMTLALFGIFAAYTVFYVPYNAWAGEISVNYHQRSRVMAWNQVAAQFGIALALISTTLASQRGVPLAGQVSLIGWMIILLFPASCLLLILTQGETPAAARAGEGWGDVRALFANGPLRQILTVTLVLGFVNGLIIPLLFFFVGSAVGLPQWSSPALLAMVLASVPILPLFLLLSKRVGKHPAFIIACLAGAGSSVAMALTPVGNLAFLLVSAILFGACFGASSFLSRTMLADVVDYDGHLTGQARGGLLFALHLSAEKIGPAIGILSGYWTLDLLGYDPAATAQTRQAVDGLRAMVGAGGGLLFGLGALLMMGYPLTEGALRRLRPNPVPEVIS